MPELLEVVLPLGEHIFVRRFSRVTVLYGTSLLSTSLSLCLLVKNSLLTKYPPTTNGKPTETSTGDGKQYTRRMCIVINDPQSDVPQYAFRL